MNDTLYYSVRSEAEIQDLKFDWKHDPCWDIEQTPGFEVWHDDLAAWRKAYEEGKAWDELQRVGAKTAELGINAALLKYIERLEWRISVLETRLNN